MQILGFQIEATLRDVLSVQPQRYTFFAILVWPDAEDQIIQLVNPS